MLADSVESIAQIYRPYVFYYGTDPRIYSYHKISTGTGIENHPPYGA
eukprot:SAG11_NODE_73_length_18072_cov_8.670005_20_plen_47_part_00